MKSNYIKAKIEFVKIQLILKLNSGCININVLNSVLDYAVEQDDTDSYYQAEAIKQAIQFYNTNRPT